jgi:5'-nucleotidase
MPRIASRLRSGRIRHAVPLVLAAAVVTASVGIANGGETDAGSGKRVYAGMAAKKGKVDKDYVKLDLLALNDFHGNLDVVPSTSSSGRINNTPAGGAAFLAGLLDEERAKSRAAGATPITVAAGDLIGASPLLSAAFHDEPSIKALNRMGLQVAAVGNHEFDEGWRELLRMQRGGCLEDGDGANGQDSCPKRQGFNGSKFQYLGANVKWKDQGKRKRSTVLPATKIMKVDGVKVGFIGMTLEGTDAIVAQAGIQGIEFTDEVETANALVPKLRKRGVKSIIVLLHEGATPSDTTAYNDCPGLSGPGLTIAENLKPAIDAVVSGHTHQPYNCVVKDRKGNNRLLTSAASFGRMVTKMHFLIDRKTGDVVRPAAYAHNRIVRNDGSIAPDSAIQRLIDVYTRLVAPIANEVLGQIAGTDRITRDADPDGQDSALGNLIADAQKADETVVQGGQAPVVALMNPGGIRADLVENDQGDVTYGAAFSVQPFNNFVASMDLTGAQIKQILNQQWNGGNEGSRKILQVSGLSYTWDLSDAELPETDALVGEVMVDADGDPATPMVPLQDGTTYRVAANNFLADGGDSFPGFTEGTNRLIGGLDIDSLRAYLQDNSPVQETPTDRISQQP